MSRSRKAPWASRSLRAGDVHGEPRRPVDLGEGPDLPRSPGPLDLEGVAPDRRDVEVTGHRPGPDALAAPLGDLVPGRSGAPPAGPSPSSSANSRSAVAAGSSSPSTSPLGIDQAPSSRFLHKGPPGWTRRTSRTPSVIRCTRRPALTAGIPQDYTLRYSHRAPSMCTAAAAAAAAFPTVRTLPSRVTRSTEGGTDGRLPQGKTWPGAVGPCPPARRHDHGSDLPGGTRGSRLRTPGEGCSGSGRAAVAPGRHRGGRRRRPGHGLPAGGHRPPGAEPRSGPPTCRWRRPTIN